MAVEQPVTSPVAAEQAPGSAPQPTTAPQPAVVGAAIPPVSPEQPVVLGTDTEIETPKALNWAERRTNYAKGDDKMLKRLSRYSSEEAILDAMLAAQDKLATTPGRATLPENPTPEQLTAWRAEQGIPESFEGYEVEIPDDAKEIPGIEAFASAYVKEMHGVHATAAQVEAGLNFQIQQKMEQAEAKIAKQLEDRTNGQVALKQEWGPEFTPNINAINGFLAQAPENVRNEIMYAELPSGVRLADSPEVLRWLANTARQLNPMATIVPATGMNSLQTVDAKLAEIRAVMGDYNGPYWKGPGSKEMREEFVKLTDTKALHSKRS